LGSSIRGLQMRKILLRARLRNLSFIFFGGSTDIAFANVRYLLPFLRFLAFIGENSLYIYLERPVLIIGVVPSGWAVSPVKRPEKQIRVGAPIELTRF
jgi:hypothetical protein